MLDHYEKQEKQTSIDLKVAQWTYKANFLFLVMSYIHMFKIWGINIPLIPIILIANIIIFLTHYSNWSSFRLHAKLAKTIIAFFIILIANLLLIPFNSSFLSLLSATNVVGNVGLITGRLFLMISITLSIILIISFRDPKHRIAIINFKRLK